MPNELWGQKQFWEGWEVQRTKVDDWISEQFRKKDFKVDGIKCGVVICDRSPLDPLAFSKENAIQTRAKQHLTILSPSASQRRLKSGHIILLSASGSELLSRAKHRHGGVGPEYFESQQNFIRKLYTDPHPAITEISTSGRSISQVVRQIAKIIHLSPYLAFDLHGRIEELQDGL